MAETTPPTTSSTPIPQPQQLTQEATPQTPSDYGPEPIPPDQAKSAGQTAAPPNGPTSQTLEWIDGQRYFASKDFAADIADYQGYSTRQTGYANLDNFQPFYPGFYVLGAISSLGKTTFAHQMADQMAAAGEHVLYFSLEQKRFELFSKSLARGFYEANQQATSYPTPSSIGIRQGIPSLDYPDKLDEQIKAYLQRVGNHVIVVDETFSADVERICLTVNQFIEATKCKPVVIVDYLQIVSPSYSGKRKMDARENVDHVVHSLKTLQANLGLSVIVISALNRQNYLTPIDFESFKESGGIEYTADVLWGLQLSVMNDDIFNSERKIAEKREIIREAKASNPRQVDLVYLKNRFGRASYTARFSYYPASDIFVPILN